MTSLLLRRLQEARIETSERVSNKTKRPLHRFYFSQTKYSIFQMCTLRQFTGSETLYPGLLSRSSGSFEDCYTPLSQGEGQVRCRNLSGLVPPMRHSWTVQSSADILQAIVLVSEEGSQAVLSKLSSCMVSDGSSGNPYLAVLVEMVLITCRGKTLRSIKIQISTKGKKMTFVKQTQTQKCCIKRKVVKWAKSLVI